jgi:hypothetical protein
MSREEARRVALNAALPDLRDRDAWRAKAERLFRKAAA